MSEISKKFVFRLAYEDDLEKIISIWDININKDYNLNQINYEDCKETLYELFKSRNSYYNFWVAVEIKTNQVIGWQSYFPIFHTPLKKNTAVESSTYIDLEYHKTGIAYELMKYALSQLSNSNIHFVYGFVNKLNLGAIKLVNKIGFVEVGILPALPTVFPYYDEKLIYIYIIQ